MTPSPTRIPRYQPTEPSRWARLDPGPWLTLAIGVVVFGAGIAALAWLVAR